MMDAEPHFAWINTTGQESTRDVQANQKIVRQQVRAHLDKRRTMSRQQYLNINYVLCEDSESDAQVVEILSEDSEDEVSVQLAESEQHERNRLQLDGFRVLPTRPGQTGYEAARTRYNFDMSLLSGLTISSIASIRGAGLESLMRYRENTFPDLVPAYYDGSKPLQRAVDAILAKTACALRPCRNTYEESLRTFDLALKDTRASLTNREVAGSTHMFCVMRLLHMYAILEASSILPQQWNSVLEICWDSSIAQSIGLHVQAMRSFVETRQPSAFVTEMDNILFCSVLRDFWLQSYTSKIDCFFEASERIACIKALTSDDLKNTARHPIALDRWIVLAPLPRLLRETELHLNASNTGANRTTANCELHTLKKKITDWKENMKSGKYESVFDFTEPRYQELIGFGMGALMVHRAIIAPAPTYASLDLESQAQDLARSTSALPFDYFVSPGLFFGLCTLAKAKEWYLALEQMLRAGKSMLDKQVWAKWVGMMGRSPHRDLLDIPWKEEADGAVRTVL